MAKVLSHQYSYANNSNGQLIHISTAQRNETYSCPICGDLMIPHKGKVRRWHFVHKSVCNCSYESYLHKLAKFKIREAFISSTHFILSYKAKAICSADCPFIGSQRCEGEKPVEFDLRKFYDTCEIEALYNRFKADLLLSSSKNIGIPPVLIEIMVTHKCTEEKINDGVRIIEIPIQSEEQIDIIIDNCIITAVRFKHFKTTIKESVITLYNFNKVESVAPSGLFDDYNECFGCKKIIVFWLNKQGQFRSFECHCSEVVKKLPANAHYFVTEVATPFKEILQGFSKRGVKIRNCFICKFSKYDTWGDRICVLYKKYYLPRKPSPYYATTCSHFREDFESPQAFIQSEYPQSIEQIDCFTGYRFYYHICEDIL